MVPLAVELEPVRVVHPCVGLGAEHVVVGVMLILPHVVGVVGGQQPHADVLGQANLVVQDGQLIIDAVVLHLDEVAPRTHDVSVALGDGPGLGVVPLQECAVHHPRQAPGGHDQALAVLRQQFVIDAGELALGSLAPRLAGQVHEVAVALVAGGQQEGVVPLEVLLRAHVLDVVRLQAGDQLDAPLLGVEVGLGDASHGAVVRDGHGGAPHFGHPVDGLLDLGRTIQHRVLRMHVEVDELPVIGHESAPFLAAKGRATISRSSGISLSGKLLLIWHYRGVGMTT